MTPVGRGSLEPYLRDEVDFFPWQIDGIRNLATRPHFLLADEMGLGKTLQALAVFCIDVYMGLAQSAIIICPPTLIGNWCDECDKFTRIQYRVLDGSPKKRDEILIEFAALRGPKILITNYEKIAKHYKQLNALRFDAGIFDEAHYIKGYKSQRTKACHSLVNGRTMLLTGTPMLGHVSDLWGLLYKLDPNGTPSYWTFINRYAVFGGYQNKQIIGVKNERELRKRIESFMLRRLAKDHLDLTAPYFVQRRVDLTVEQRRIYDKIKSDLKVERPEDSSDEEIANALVKFTRLKQACSSTISFNGIDESPKLDLCIADDAELFDNGKKVIIFTQFRDIQKSYIDRHLKMYATKRPALIQSFRIENEFKSSIPVFSLNGDVPADQRQRVVNEWSSVNGPAVIVCMIQVAGVGLNMVASHNIAFLDKLFVPALNAQAVSRAHRLGQTQPVTVREYITRNTVENRVEAILNNKTKLFGEIVENSPDWKKEMLKMLIEQGRIDD